LQFDPIFDSAQIVAQMQIAARLDAGKNSLFAHTLISYH